jgi:hypothetical protein
LSVLVTSVGGAGDITGVEINNPGNGYVDGQIVQVVGGANDALLDLTVYTQNPLGWQSYKVVVKQQEQEYYNVYLPGYISGYPIQGIRDEGRVAFASLFSDNVNKVPRDLNEVGPLQTEFSASVRLIGRVNNPNPNNKAGTSYNTDIEYYWNTQYFPGRTIDEVTTIGPVGEGGLELATSPFETSTQPASEFQNPNSSGTLPAQIPWGTIGASQSFYKQEENTLAIGLRVGAQDPQPQLTVPTNRLNTLGATVTDNTLADIIAGPAGIACMTPFYKWKYCRFI